MTAPSPAAPDRRPHRRIRTSRWLRFDDSNGGLVPQRTTTPARLSVRANAVRELIWPGRGGQGLLVFRVPEPTLRQSTSASSGSPEGDDVKDREIAVRQADSQTVRFTGMQTWQR